MDIREIPPAPSDPEERRVWKNTWYPVLYGMSNERFQELMEKAEIYNIKQDQRNKAKRIVALVWLGIVIFLLGYFLGATHGLQ